MKKYTKIIKIIKSIITTAIILTFLTTIIGCKEDMPPSPPPLGEGAFGRAVAGIATGMPTWAAEGRGITLTPTEVNHNEGMVVSITNFDMIYYKGYYFDSIMREWRPFYLSGEKTQDWIKTFAIGTITAKKSEFKEGDNFLVVYACNKVGRTWECNNRRWMLQPFKVKEIPSQQEIEGAEKYIINTDILPYQLKTISSAHDDFDEIPNRRYDANYWNSRAGITVVARVFNFDTKEQIDTVLNGIFKDIFTQGYQNYQGNGIGSFLDQESRRVATWPSGLNIIYIETYTPAFISKEITEAYLGKYPSDLK